MVSHCDRNDRNQNNVLIIIKKFVVPNDFSPFNLTVNLTDSCHFISIDNSFKKSYILFDPFLLKADSQGNFEIFLLSVEMTYFS